MKTAISIPDPIYKSAERLARRLSISRSKLYSTAIEKYVEQKVQQDITEKLNEIYKDESNRIDPVLAEIQLRSLDGGKW